MTRWNFRAAHSFRGPRIHAGVAADGSSSLRLRRRAHEEPLGSLAAGRRLKGRKGRAQHGVLEQSIMQMQQVQSNCDCDKMWLKYGKVET